MMSVAWRLRESEQIHKTVSLHNVFSYEEINKIKQHALTIEEKKPFIKTDAYANDVVLEENIRKCKVKWIEPVEECQWIFKRLVDVVHNVNSRFFNLNLYGLQALQYTIYSEQDQDFYSMHRDSNGISENGLVRKLSFSMQLTEPSEYEGGDLVTDVVFHPNIASREFGVLNFFVSDMLHEAKPVTKGCRHVLVGWVVGPPSV